MKTKPFKQNIEDIVVKVKKEESAKPFKVEAQEMLNTSDEEMRIEEDEDNSVSQSSIQRTIGFFSTISGIVVAVFLFVFIMVIADTVNSIGDIYKNGSVSEYIYLAGLVLLLIVFLLNISTNIKQIQFIKNAKLVKEKFKLQRNKPSKEIIPLANILLKHYESNSDKNLQTSIEHIRDELNTSQIYNEIYNDLDNSLLSVIDDKAKKLIHNASVQAALSTAASPIPIFDMVLIIWRSTLLTKDIASLYGFRPGGLTTISLLRQGVINIAFAGVAEMATDITNDMAGSTVLAKVSKSAGQGIANGVLLARLGYGIMEACRPIESDEKRGSFIKSITKLIIDAFGPREEANLV